MFVFAPFRYDEQIDVVYYRLKMWSKTSGTRLRFDGLNSLGMVFTVLLLYIPV